MDEKNTAKGDIPLRCAILSRVGDGHIGIGRVRFELATREAALRRCLSKSLLPPLENDASAILPSRIRTHDTRSCAVDGYFL